MMAGIARSEWTKIRTLRSTVSLLLLTFALSVALAFAGGATAREAIARGSTKLRPDFDPINAGIMGLQYGQLALIAFATLVVCGEYGSGTIRPSLAAVPRRGMFYGGKVLTGGVVAFVVAVVTGPVSFVVTEWALGPYGVPLGHGESWRVVVGAPLYLTLMSVFAIGVATMVRRAAVTIAVLFVTVLALSPLASRIPALHPFARYLPDQAGSQVMLVGQQADPALGPWTGLFTLFLWAAAAVAGGYVVLSKRDS
jgi:ABC-2 type transport system permease protein